jgi:conjugative relaxase-like TrwC/TraI family protein
MLSLGKLAPGQQQYYLDTVAKGAEEYYTGAKEAPGQWVGRGTERLGLTGVVDPDALGDVLSGRDPRVRLPLTRAQGAPSVPGFDATFCAPKSVSLLYSLGDPETSNEVRNAHDAAVAGALKVLESVAARARRGKAGVERIEADGFVAAAFRHRTSRAGDPHLHTHVVIANVVHAPTDGRWSALDARPLYAWAKTVGYLYESQLRTELTRRLGVEWGAVRNGIADLAGIPSQVLRAFSRRRQEIEAHLAKVGEDGPRAAQVAAYATRTPKGAAATLEASPTEWLERARAHGLDLQDLGALLHRVAPAEIPDPNSELATALFEHLAGPAGLTAHHATFGRREVLQALTEALPPGADVTPLVELADAFLTSRHVVSLREASGLRTADVIRRRDGVIVATRVDEARWTTREILDVEDHLVRVATLRRHDRTGVADVGATKDAIGARPELTREQTRLVQRLTRSGAGVEVVEGAAGTGKTFALDAARQAWEASGYRVIGCSLAARAALQLQEGSGIRSVTLDRLLHELDRQGPAALGTNNVVVVVDEAAIVGTRKLAKLLDHAEAARAKVVLVGDHHQLPEVDAGGAFAGLASRLGSIKLHENRRQRSEWERRALSRLRAGSTDRALAAYQAHGRVHVEPDTDAARHRLVSDWIQARRVEGSYAMLAQQRRDVDELNRIAREHLRAEGHIGLHDTVIAGRAFAIGDEVLATRNDYDLDVLNGTRATITAIDPQNETVRASTPDGREINFPSDYLSAGNLSHAYATTFHKAQGTTVHQSFVLVRGTIDREYAYSGLSRGAEANSIYLADHGPRVEDQHAPELEPHALDRLSRGLHTSSAKSMARDLADGIGLER